MAAAAIVLGVAFFTFAITAICLAVAARRSGISKRGWLVLQLAGIAAPDFSTAAAITRAIAKDRARGPAFPATNLRRRLEFSDEMLGPDRIFRVAPKAAAVPLRLFYLHGGGYVLDLQAVQWGLITGLIDRTGAELIAPIYPLAPEHGWAEGFDAVQRSYLALLRECPADHVVICADSAGCGLALGLLQRLRHTASLPAATVMFSPWLDTSVSGPDQPELEQRDPALSTAFLRHAGAMWAQRLPMDDPQVSPLFGDQDGLPPILVFTGTRDILDSDARRLAARNRNVTLRSYRNMFHVWPAAGMIPEAGQALDEAADFIKGHVKLASRQGRPPA